MDIRNLRPSDIPSALALINDEGWNYTAGELERMLALDPEGSFIYESEKPMGIIMGVSYGRTGVIGHLVVSKKVRGKRIGQSLLAQSLDYFDGVGADSVLLYATEEGARLYLKTGFVKRREAFCVNGKLPKLSLSETGLTPSPMEERDIHEVVAMDAEFFGDDRSKLLGHLSKEFPEHSLKVVDDGVIVGFIMARDSPVGYDLGPWVCSTGRFEDASNLFSAEVATFRRGSMFMPGFVENRQAWAIGGKLDSIVTWKTDMMVRGRGRYESDISKVFGMAAYELG